MVVGATYPDELRSVAQLCAAKQVPLLIPGVGRQGGSAAGAASILRKAGYELALCRINSSSAICYAFEKEKTKDYAGAAVRALRALNEELLPYLG
jgi:orotidine-5'-phosphate decarboxylase